MEEIIKGFVAETVKGLTDTINICLSVDTDMGQKEAEKVFFVMHSLTGSSAMFGFDDVAQYSLYTERVFDRIRKGDKQATPEILENTIQISYAIKSIVLKEDMNSSRKELIEFFKNQLDK